MALLLQRDKPMRLVLLSRGLYAFHAMLESSVRRPLIPSLRPSKLATASTRIESGTTLYVSYSFSRRFGLLDRESAVILVLLRRSKLLHNASRMQHSNDLALCEYNYP